MSAYEAEELFPQKSEYDGAQHLLDIIEEKVTIPGCSDVLINSQRLWVDSGQGLQEHSFPPTVKEKHVRELAIRLAAQTQRRLDIASPIVDAQTPQGWRLHAVLPPVAHPGTLISIRIPRAHTIDFDMCIRQGWHPHIVDMIRATVAAKRSMLIAGATGSGKTTLLSAAIDCIPSHERVICIEEVPEIKVNHPHCVFLHERSANIHGKGALPLGELVRAAMRMRPDRLILGECRGREIADVMTAFNTGHPGGAMTIHANSTRDIPARLQALGASARMSEREVIVQSHAAFDVLIHMSRGNDGIRRAHEIAVWDPLSGTGAPGVQQALTMSHDGQCLRGPGWRTLQKLVNQERL